ncbi:MAG: hypothetical protein GX676_02345 [Bacilli bacterium]|nr:hypothetical protein [Bacilli bacterium]
MTFTADLYCESTKIDTITFNVIGQLVKYEGKEYVMGTAYYTGNLIGKRFNDVANVHLRNSNKYILYGGILHWFGTYDDNNESGIAVHNGIPGYDVTYMPKNPRDDLARNEYQIISITGIIVSTGNNASDSVRYPELGKTQFKANLYCEGTDVGYVTFDVLGVKVELNGTEYLYGFAVYNGTPCGKRFNDVDKIKLYNPTKEIKSGGHLYWRGSYDDTNETGMAIYNKTYSNYVEYISENPTNDFAANTNNFVIITGIVVKTGNKANGEYIPKLVNTSLDATLYCESLYIKRIKLDIIGFETLDGHIIGNASYTGNPGSSRFNDVGNIKLLDPSISIRYGGTLGWWGTINDNNESGVAGWDASDKSRIIYMSDTPYNDMACNEELNLRISFFCLKKSN